MLGRFYAICNCCSCCCGAMQAHRNGVPMLASSGFTSRADPEECLRCGECAGLCGFGAISMTERGPLVSRDRCMGCGVCVDKCPGGCLTLVRDPDKCPPLDIGALLQRAAGQQ